MSSSFGRLFRITTFGESHGPAIGVVIDGCPPRLALSVADIQRDLDRRRPGQSRLVTQRKEDDKAEILSGVFGGHTTGTPIAILVRNTDHNPGAYEHMKEVYRPSHGDFTYDAKFGIRDWRGGGRASARETVGRVAAGAVARKLLESVAGIEVLAWVQSVRNIEASVDGNKVTLAGVEIHPTRCPDPKAAEAMAEAIENARRDGDSLGGTVTCVARGVPAGLGEPVFDKLDADIGGALLSLPAAKGVEIGSGFAGTLLTGSNHNDPFVAASTSTRSDGPQISTTSNHSGGIQAGISNGQDVVVRVAFKPTATIATKQSTVSRSGEPAELAVKGRHDPCVLPRAVPLVESMVLLCLADHYLRQSAINILPPLADLP